MLPMTDKKVEAFKKLLKNTDTPEKLDNVLSSMDASSKYGPLLLQGMGRIGRQSVVDEYKKNFRETEED
jgi:hypothetical protein